MTFLYSFHFDSRVSILRKTKILMQLMQCVCVCVCVCVTTYSIDIATKNKRSLC